MRGSIKNKAKGGPPVRYLAPLARGGAWRPNVPADAFNDFSTFLRIPSQGIYLCGTAGLLARCGACGSDRSG